MDTLTIDDQKKMWQEREILKLFGAQEDFKTPSLRQMSRRIDAVEAHLERSRKFDKAVTFVGLGVTLCLLALVAASISK